MRRNFAQILKEGKIDINKEYEKLYDLFYYADGYRDSSLEDIVGENFGQINFQKTCISLDDFNETFGFNFVQNPPDFNIDHLILFCEYFYNFANAISEHDYSQPDKVFYTSHVERLIENMGYTPIQEDGLTVFVPKDNVAIAVAESALIPKNISYKLIAYNHHSRKGDLEAKKHILLVFADLLEPKRKELEQIDKPLASDLFYAFNNFNIRHNNTDPTGPKYKQPIGAMSTEDLEMWYDEVYQMCLLAFMRLDHIPRKQSFDNLKNLIEGK